MIDLRDYICESKTSINNIKNYGKSWTTEYLPEEFKGMLENFLTGVEEGLNENAKYGDKKLVEEQLELLVKMKELLK